MKYTTKIIANLIIILALSILVSAQTSTFTFQGRLNDNSLAANGSYQMQFSLFDSVTGGTQVGSTTELTDVSAVNGVFTVRLDFGASAFDGNDRFIEISVRRNATESYTTLAPRQFVTSVPYSITARNASTANLANTANSAGFATTAGDANTLDGLDSTEFISNLSGIGGLGVFRRIGGSVTLQTRVSDVYTRVFNNSTANPNTTNRLSAECFLPTEIAINGGVFFVGHDSSIPNYGFARRLEVLSSAPSTTDPYQWHTYFRNPTDNVLLLRGFIVCLRKGFN